MQRGDKEPVARPDDDTSRSTSRTLTTVYPPSSKLADPKSRSLRSADGTKRNATKGLAAVDISDGDDKMAANNRRRDAQLREIAALKARMRTNLSNTAARTDNDISDEEAGQHRLRLAEASRQRRNEEQKLLRQANAKMRQRISAMKPRNHEAHQKSRRALAEHGPLKPAEAAALAAEVAEQRRAEIHEEDEAAELQLLRQLLARSAVAEKKAQGWNSSPHRPVPYTLRGMRPMHTMDPWSKDVMLERKHQQLPPGSSYSTACLTRLDDGMHDSVAALFNRQRKEERATAEQTSRPAWDPTPWRYVPPALRGVKPVTSEPWADDLELYQRRQAKEFTL
jgi:hypothetical protein